MYITIVIYISREYKLIPWIFFLCQRFLELVLIQTNHTIYERILMPVVRSVAVAACLQYHSFGLILIKLESSVMCDDAHAAPAIRMLAHVCAARVCVISLMWTCHMGAFQRVHIFASINKYV